MFTIHRKTLAACMMSAIGALIIGSAHAGGEPAAGTADIAHVQSVYPPWQHGANNDTPARGLSFTEPDADNLADFHGDPIHPSLVLYVGGNYFFPMSLLVPAFETQYPQYKGHVYWETIPPGL